MPRLFDIWRWKLIRYRKNVFIVKLWNIYEIKKNSGYFNSENIKNLKRDILQIVIQIGYTWSFR